MALGLSNVLVIRRGTIDSLQHYLVVGFFVAAARQLIVKSLFVVTCRLVVVVPLM